MTSFSFGLVAQRVLGRLLPSKTKRLIVLSSLAAKIKDIHDPDRATLEKLNEIFSLCENPNALRLPILAQERIWRSFNPVILRLEGIEFKKFDESICLLSASQKRIVANRLIREMPEWLRYQSNTFMRKEVFALLNKLLVV